MKMKFRPQFSFKIQEKLQLQRLTVDNAKDLHLGHFTTWNILLLRR